MNLANLHPLLVHLPIGIFFIGFLIELWNLKNPNKLSKDLMLFILANAALFALLSVLTGWFLGDSGSYDETALDRHKWLGIAFTVSAIVLFFVKRSNRALAQKAYLPLFSVCLVLLTLTGHYGGNMTHGEGFLFADHSAKVVEIENIEEAQVYQQIIHPILETKCVGCHNSNKLEGGLILKTQQQLLAGGDSGHLFDTLPEHGATLFMHRLRLPIEHEEHMPPEGKQQLTEEEILLMEWWIANKNCFECKVADLHANPHLEDILASLETDNSTRGKLARELDFVAPEEIAALNQKGISVQQFSEDNPLLTVNFSRRKDITDQDFDFLKNVADNVVELNLGYTNFNDDLAKSLKEFENLTKLQLQGTSITSKTLKQLKKLEFLESLNLFGIDPSNLDMGTIKEYQSLANLYVSPEVFSEEKFQNLGLNGVKVHGQDLEKKFKSSELYPPVIVSDGEIFNDSILVSINSVFEDAKTFYRYERAPGDTLTKEYKEPFYLKRSATLLAHSEKDGWDPSESSKAFFLKTGAKIAKAELKRSPHPKYQGVGIETLIDKKRGTTNFVDGKWLGYEASHLQATLHLQEPTTISSVSIGHLSAPNSWIFSPVGYKVWGTNNGSDYKLLKVMDVLPDPPSSGVEKHLVNVDFDEMELRSLRIEVVNQLKNPDWHQVPGGNSFIFIDEIVLN